MTIGIISGLCRKNNEVRSKKGALAILRDILGIPLGEPEPNGVTGHRPLTVVEALGVGVAEGVVVEKYDV
jgi:hypothetical protein